MRSGDLLGVWLPGKTLHAEITGCDDLWQEMDAEEKSRWIESEKLILTKFCEAANRIAENNMLKTGKLVEMVKTLTANVEKMKPKRIPQIIQTAAGPMCSNCGRGWDCWLAPDESPCQCVRTPNRRNSRTGDQKPMKNPDVLEQPKAPTPVACSDLFGALVDSMKRVEEWEISRYELTHKPTGLILWIANGWAFLEADQDSPIPLSPSLLERMRLWQHVKRLRNTIMAQKLSAPNVRS